MAPISNYLIVEDVKTKTVYVYTDPFSIPSASYGNAFVYADYFNNLYHIYKIKPEENPTPSHIPSVTTNYNYAYYRNLYEELDTDGTNNGFDMKITQFTQLDPDLSPSGGAIESDQNIHIYRQVSSKVDRIEIADSGGSTIDVSLWDVFDETLTEYYDGMVIGVRVPSTHNLDDPNSTNVDRIALRINGRNTLDYKTVVYDDTVNNNFYKKCLAGSILFFVYNAGVKTEGYGSDYWYTDKMFGVWQNITIANVYEMGGGGEIMTSVTHSQLSSLISGGTLVKGMKYRITDYVATTVQSNTQSANHPFDIVVTAIDADKLDNQATALPHSGDTYFTNAQLNMWKLWYDVNNDTTKYAWADSTNGKGVIYRMIDEWNNDCSYDFKGIQFKRKLTDGVLDTTGGTDTFVYTFNAWDTVNQEIKDASLLHGQAGYSVYLNRCSDNTIGACFNEGVNNRYRRLNDNVFLNRYGSSTSPFNNCFGNTLGIGCANNTFGERCYNNTFGNHCAGNTLGNDFVSNNFGNGCNYNTFGTSCQYNTFADMCISNTFGDVCSSNTLGVMCMGNTFGDNCEVNVFGDNSQSNALGDDFVNNTFGFACSSNVFGDSCDNNVFENNCTDNTFGGGCTNNTLGNSCNHIIFGNSGTPSVGGTYCRNNIVENGNQYIRLYQTVNEGSSSHLQNVYIAQSVNNTTTYLDISTIARGLAYRTTVGRKSDTTLNIYNEDDSSGGGQGIQGIQGIQGLQGLQGVQGTTGLQGVQGTIGLQGLQGLQGVQGTQGTQGVQGVQGSQGTQGLQGVQGVQGSQGTQGTQGLQGVQGTQGTQGTQGIQGTYGIQGIQGLQGITDYSFTHTTNTTVTSPYTFTCAANQRNSQMITTGANLTLNITCNNGSDNYLWIINSSSSADIDVVIGTVTYNGNTLSASSIYLPSDGISIPKSGLCEIGIIINADGCIITSRNDLSPSA